MVRVSKRSLIGRTLGLGFESPYVRSGVALFLEPEMFFLGCRGLHRC